MITIESYLKIDDDFVNVQEHEHKLPSSFYDGGVLYADGAIDLVVNHVQLINLSMWDYVDQLWAYILEGLANLLLGKDFTTYFPDQAIKIEFLNIERNQVKICVHPREGVNKSVIEINEFVAVVVNEAEAFFSKLEKLTRDVDYEYEKKIINAIKNKEIEVLKTIVD